MERIESQMRGLRALAKRVLSWITCAKRPLTTTQLRHALAVKRGDRELDECNLRDISEMVSVCAGLVTVDEQSNTIRLVHYTAQEYFKETRKRWFEDAELDMANTCATYLSFDEFDGRALFLMNDNGPNLPENGGYRDGYQAQDFLYMELGALLSSNPLYEYAACNWGHHARACSAPELGEVSRFLGLQVQMQVSCEALVWEGNGKPNHPDHDQMAPLNWTALHLATHFGAEEVVRTLLRSQDADARDGNGWTALSHAVSMGLTGVARVLLEGGADVDASGRCGLLYSRTPLGHAVMKGNEAMVELLLGHGANTEAAPGDGLTPLCYAAAQGHVGIVKLLLEGGADAGYKTRHGYSALYHADMQEHWDIVQLLVDHGA